MIAHADCHSDGPGFVHVTLCVGPDGRVNFYPDGDPERLAERLAFIVQLFSERPTLIRCAVGACDGACGHG